MAQKPIPSASALVTWKFQVVAQGFITRYGSNGGMYYKQFMPGGLDVPELYPPKPITKQLYDLADRAPGRMSVPPSA